MTTEVNLMDVEIGVAYTLKGTGVAKEGDGRYVYDEECAKNGETVRVVRKYDRYINTSKGYVFNPDATFTPVAVDNGTPLADIVGGRGYSTQGGLIGSDPEIFAIDGMATVIPAWRFLGAQRGADNKSNTDGYYGNFVSQQFWDGFQAEMTITPYDCHEQVVDAIHYGLGAIYQRAQSQNLEATLTGANVIDVPRAMMEEATDEHVALGCAPSLSAYNATPIDVPDPRALPIRFAGFHIHHGGDFPKSRAIKVVKGMDAIFGILGTSLLAGLEDSRRRTFYGRAGEYRLPPHGLEYRVPSATSLMHPVLAHLTLDLVRTGRAVADAGVSDPWGIGDDETQRIINEGDVDAARAIISRCSDNVEGIVRMAYRDARARYVALRLITEGAKSLLPDLNNLAVAWKLDEGDYDPDAYDPDYDEDEDDRDYDEDGPGWHDLAQGPNCQVSTTTLIR